LDGSALKERAVVVRKLFVSKEGGRWRGKGSGVTGNLVRKQSNGLPWTTNGMRGRKRCKDWG